MTTVSLTEVTRELNKNGLSLKKKRFQPENMPNPVDIFLGKTTFVCPHSKSLTEISNQDNLLGNFKLFLLFGKFIGLIPIQGFFQNNPQELKFRTRSSPSILSLIICALLSANVVAGVIGLYYQGANSAAEYAWAPAMAAFYGNGFFLYVFFYRKSERLIEIIKKWNGLQLEFTAPDLNLYRDVNLIAGFILTSAILENAFGHLRFFPLIQHSKAEGSESSENENSTALEIYYNRSHDKWARLVPYNPIMAIYVLISNKFALYAWNFMDIIIAIFGRTIYFKFKVLYFQAEEILFRRNYHSQFDTTKWRQLTADHETLMNMLFDIGNLLSPLVFVSYSINIYYICLQLYLGLSPAANNNTIAALYAVWSFLHLIARIYIVSICGARCNDWVHRIKLLFRRCPNEAYITEVERAERFVSVNEIGLTGLGCFVITKPLILQVVGVVFTFEIVLLQAGQTMLGNGTTGNPASLCKTN